MIRTIPNAVFLTVALAALLAVGCEDSGVTAPTESTVTVTANPATITIDPNVLVEDPPGSGIFVPQSEGQSRITARFRNKSGTAIEGVAVAFSSTAGTLASYDAQAGQSRTVITNSDGVAEDVLTVGTLGPASIDVTAASGTINGKVTIAKVVGAVNQPPVAAVVISPANEQGVNLPVEFDGTASSDPDDDPITMYRWTIFSTSGASPDVEEAEGASALVRTYTAPQTLSGTLQVTDDPSAPAQQARGEPIVYRSTASFTYQIVAVVCSANTAPVAVIAGPSTVPLSGTAGSTVSVTLDGSLSTDAEGAIAEYVWSCGGDAVPVPVPGTDGKQVQCSYTVLSTAKSYVATLAVKDRGTGVPNGDGTYPCQKISPQVSVTVQVTAVAPTAR